MCPFVIIDINPFFFLQDCGLNNKTFKLLDKKLIEFLR